MPRLAGARAAAVVLAALTAGACGGGSSPSTAPTSSTATAPPTTAAAARLAFGPPVLRGEIADERRRREQRPGRVPPVTRAGCGPTTTPTSPPVLFCVEPDGSSCGALTVDGAANVDWEDIAAGPGPDPATAYLYIGDIGDNTESRDGVVVYRVAEPAVTTGRVRTPAARPPPPPPSPCATTTAPTTPRASWCTRPPATSTSIVKEIGDTGVYRARAGEDTLTRVANLGLGLFGLATGADISPDGRRVAVCTPVGGFELTLAAGAPFDDIWDGPPAPVAFPGLDQGEGIAYRLDGDALFVTSEGSPSPLYEIPRL